MAELLAITWVGARARPLPRAALCAPQALGALGAGAAGHTCSSHSLVWIPSLFKDVHSLFGVGEAIMFVISLELGEKEKKKNRAH